MFAFFFVSVVNDLANSSTQMVKLCKGHLTNRTEKKIPIPKSFASSI